MPYKEKRQSKISLKNNGVAAFNSKNNASNLCRFFSNLAYSLLKKLPRLKNKFGIKTTDEYYKQIRKECVDFVLHSIDVTTIDKI